MSSDAVTDADYRQLLELRSGLRRFLRWSAEQARSAGLTPAQHQLLLAVRGHPDRKGPTVAEVADYLQLKHNSTVELIDRAQRDGLVERHTDPDDARIVRIGLTPEAESRLAKLSQVHLEELRRLAPRITALWSGLDQTTD
ncbi:MAG TPA: MarR family transcriptional regulator [Acidimicrobiia bacterium]|jgi:DNA-binding MarR family transcriptional regulator